MHSLCLLFKIYQNHCPNPQLRSQNGKFFFLSQHSLISPQLRIGGAGQHLHGDVQGRARSRCHGYLQNQEARFQRCYRAPEALEEVWEGRERTSWHARGRHHRRDHRALRPSEDGIALLLVFHRT